MVTRPLRPRAAFVVTVSMAMLGCGKTPSETDTGCKPPQCHANPPEPPPPPPPATDPCKPPLCHANPPPPPQPSADAGK